MITEINKINIYHKIYNCARFIFANFFPVNIQRKIEGIKEKKLYKSYNSPLLLPHNNEVICMIDGKFKHGGLTDRINGIISCFHASMNSGRLFRINFTCPFNLYDYLVPNEFQWIISSEEIAYNFESKPIFIRAFNKARNSLRGRQLIRAIEQNPRKQLHVYTNINIVEEETFRKIFHKLFKPSDRLCSILNMERKRIGNSYISATFRFQQLLNDFNEGDYSILSPQKATNLIIRNLQMLIKLHDLYPTDKILVTSDSKTFLNEAIKFPFVMTTSGETIHMEYNDNSDFMTQAKAFVDLFLLSEAKVIYSIVIKPMYNSGFPKLASIINNRPFKIIS